MNCYECAKTGAAVAAVATCLDCNCGLCLDHLREAAADRARGGMYFRCRHDTWRGPHAPQAAATAL